MAIPEYNEIKAPALQLFSDGKARRISEVRDVLAKHLNLSDDEMAELLPSGTQSRWHNRADWACYDLFRAGLLERPKRGTYVITDLGRKIAKENPKHIDRDYLLKFPAFAKFVEPKNKKDGTASPLEPSLAQTCKTPQETIEAAYRALNANLKSELLGMVKQMDPFKFEQLVLDLLVAMGYGGSKAEAAKVTKASNDEGIDGVINEDRLGLDVIYVQAKRWRDKVGRPVIQSFVGALAGQKAQKGIFITSGEFATNAEDYHKNIQQKIILIDGDRLADLMIEHNIGISKSHSYELKRIDSDYFEES